MLDRITVFRKIVLLVAVFITMNSINSVAAVYYWVGNTGNWSDAANHWASGSGGVPGSGLLPTASDSAIFDINSFAFSTDIATVDVPAVCEALIQEGSGTVLLSNTLTVITILRLNSGTLNTNGQSVSCLSLNANAAGDPLRTLNLGSSSITISGSGTCLDLRGNTFNLTLTSLPTSAITFTNSANFTIEVGSFSKTIPNLLFSTITNNTVTINSTSAATANIITFQNISKTNAGTGAINIDGTLNATTFKQFGTINIPNSTTLSIGTNNAAAYGANPRTQYKGALTMGNSCTLNIRGAFSDFNQSVTMGTLANFDIRDAVQFNSSLTIGSATGTTRFRNPARFQGAVNLNGSVTNFQMDNTTIFNGAFTIASLTNVTLFTDGGQTVSFNGNFNVGAESIIRIGNGANTPFSFSSINCNAENRITFNTATSNLTIGNISVASFDQIELNTTSTTTITGTFTAAINCKNWTWLNSRIGGTQAALVFSSPQTVTGLMISDVNCTSSNITVNNGIDQGNNTGVSFSGSVVGSTFYWVGGTAGNPKTQALGTGANNNWSNCANWASSSGDISNTNTCIPSIVDNVIFDALSFTHATNKSVDMDLIAIFCNDFTWNTAVGSGALWDGGIPANTIPIHYIAGSVSISATTTMTNQFEGLVSFTPNTIANRNITSNGNFYAGPIEFDFIGGNWKVQDNLEVRGNASADIAIKNGTLDGQAGTIKLEDDWTVNTPNGFFTCGTSTVEFRGQTANASSQDVTTNGSAFYNVVVNRQANGTGGANTVTLLQAITVNNNLTITTGNLYDNGFQITGNATGTFTMAANTNMQLGDNGTASATVFPTNYTTTSLANNSTVEYRDRAAIQNISHIPTYGNLTFGNGSGMPFKVKLATGAITIARQLHVDDFAYFRDNGFQITGAATQTIRLDPNTVLELGTAGVATQFPLNFTVFTIDVRNKVLYNSGLAQVVKSLSAGNTAGSYGVVQFSNASTKTLAGAIYVRDTLSITAGATLDASASNFAIDLRGHWLNTASTFVARTGLVTFLGTAQQRVTSNGSDFYSATINNAAGILLQGSAGVGGICTFTNGIVTCTSPNTLIFRDNATSVTPSNVSHAFGEVRKIGNDLFDFPVGTLLSHRPCGIATAPSAVTDSYTAYYVNSTPNPTYDRSQLAATLDHVSDCEYWMISRDAGTSSVLIKLSWDQTISCTITDPTGLAVAHWNGASWDDLGNSVASPLGTTGFVTASTLIGAFSPFTLADLIGGIYNPLPVDLISFDAKIENKNVLLNWTVINEENLALYDVERSRNGLSYSSVATVLPTSVGGSKLYSTIDKSPLTGTSYYRLKMFDKNGSFTYSKIISISIQADINIYPNPTEDGIIFMDFDSEIEEVLVVLQDVLGKVVYQKIIVNKGRNELELLDHGHKLESGIYLIVASNDHMLANKKIIVK